MCGCCGGCDCGCGCDCDCDFCGGDCGWVLRLLTSSPSVEPWEDSEEEEEEAAGAGGYETMSPTYDKARGNGLLVVLA